MSKSSSLLRERDFLRLWVAQSVSEFGARVTREGLPIMAVLTLNAPPSALGVLAAVAGGAGLLASLGSGGVVDRSRRRPILVWADLGRAGALLTLPLAAWLHVLSLIQVYGVAAGIAGASALFDIADHAYLPSLVGRERVTEANARLGSTEGAAEMAGPALAGVLFQWLTAPVAVVVNAATYLASALALSQIRAVEPVGDARPARTGVISGLVTGAGLSLGDPLARVLLFTSSMGGLFGGFFSALYILFVLRTLGLGPVILGLGIACGGLGALAGSLAVPRLVRLLGVGPSIVLCSAGSALGTMILLFAPAHRVGAVGFLIGQQFTGDFLGVIPVILGTSLLQSIIAGEALGRVRAVFRGASGLAAVIGSLAGGVLGQALGVRQTLFLAIGGLLIGPLVSVLTPLWRVGEMPQGVSASP
jgi:Transmembrane secretion effector